ncbi:hypothetical protein [Hymenobacter sp.]|jgi:hypothetical protein|uniref:hypothetical protein n=1 Tax=Hymenobacter sp. TaxID=1898978 RepID=UPI002EDB87BA
MKFSYLGRPIINKITGKAVGLQRERTDTVVRGLLQAIPELIAASVVDIKSGRTLSAFTSTSSFDPYKTNMYNVEVIGKTYKSLANSWLSNQDLDDIIIVLDHQFHCIRTMNHGQWYCYLVVGKAETNLAIVKDIMRKHTR